MTKAMTRAQRLKEASAKRRRDKKVATRRAILDASYELFQEQGYEDFSLRQVAEAIGYSPTTIYLYFADKDDLLFHTAMEGFRTFGARLQAAYDSSADPLERLRAQGRAYVEFGLEHPVSYRLMFMQRGEFLSRELPESEAPVIDSFGILFKTVEECLSANLIKPGDARSYSALIWAGVHGVVALVVGTPHLSSEEAIGLLELHHSILLNGIKQ